MRLITGTAIVCLATAAAVAAVRDMTRPAVDTVLIGNGPMRELGARNQDIAFYERRIAEDPRSAADLAQVSGLYLQRARESADYEDFRRAERAARRSVTLRTSRNGKAQLLLASSLLAQHRFLEARTEAEKLVSMDSSAIGYRALLAEIHMELGDYRAAARSFNALANASEDLSVAPRLARWNEINGKDGTAKRLLENAVASARGSDLPREQIAWFFLRLGDFQLRHGALQEAESALRAGLAYEPNDFRLISGLARVEFARSQWRQAISLALLVGDRADLATRALLGDSYVALGHHREAERVFAEIEETAAANPEPFNRQWTQFLIDHDRSLPQALAVLEREITIRPDVLGYDQLAWAYYKAGDIRNARKAIEQALRMGTRDATLRYHAGEIAFASGDRKAARQHFAAALEINKHFHPLQARTARARLAALN